LGDVRKRLVTVAEVSMAKDPPDENSDEPLGSELILKQLQ
jgi:hypothetical protein